MIAVVGVLQDKLQPDLFTAMAERVDHWYIVDLSAEPRGASAQAVQACLQACVPAEQITVCGAPLTGLNQVDLDSTADDQILVFGSFVTVAATMRWMRQSDSV